MNLGIEKTQQFTSLNSAYCFRSFPMKHDLFTSTEAIWGCRIVLPCQIKDQGTGTFPQFIICNLSSSKADLFIHKAQNKLDESMYRSFIQLLHQVKWFICNNTWFIRHFIRPTSVSKSWSTPIAGGWIPAYSSSKHICSICCSASIKSGNYQHVL